MFEGMYGFAAGDRVNGVRLGDMIGREHRYVGSDGQRHVGTVVGVFPEEGTYEPCVQLRVGYSGSTWVYATTFVAASNGSLPRHRIANR